MNTELTTIISEYQSKLGGYAGMLYYRYCNLCVKADPVSLLSATVVTEYEVGKIENVAAVVPGDDDFSLELHAYDNDNIVPLAKAVFREHPEFKIDILRSDDRQPVDMEHDMGKPIFILLTMPAVDDERYRLLVDAVKTLHDEAAVKIDENTASYTKKVLDAADPDDDQLKDELKEQIKQINDFHVEKINEIRDSKLAEIEAGHEQYLADNSGKNNGMLQFAQCLDMN